MDSHEYILISAHHCAPNMGSEHAVGWNLVSRLAQHHPILLVTQDNEYRSAIESAVQSLRLKGAVIEAFFIRHDARTDGRKNNLRVFYYLAYIIYQRRVLALSRSLLTRYRIAVVHHLTIVGFREPGFLWQLGIPFVWGPVGGLVYAPLIMFGDLSPKMKLFQGIRNILTWVQFTVSPRVRSAYRAANKSGYFVAATPDIGELFQRRLGGEFVWIPETGSTTEGPAESGAPPRTASSPLELLWVGGLLDIKPLGVLLDAIALIPNHQRHVRLNVVGDGDARGRFEEQARNLGINVQFVGWIDHAAVNDQFKRADLFVLLSIKDLTTNVVFESLGAGVPVICLDHHGYSHIVDETCGRKIPLLDPKPLRQQLATELIRFIEEPALLKPLSEGARRRASNFTWDRNAAKIGLLYNAIKAKTKKTHNENITDK